MLYTKWLMSRRGQKPVRNSFVILREEFDDWAILFDPDTGRGFGLNPTGVFLWKLLDGELTIDEMVGILRRHACRISENLAGEVDAFLNAMSAEGLCGLQGDGPERPCDAARAALEIEACSLAAEGCTASKSFTYESPMLVEFGGGRKALGDCGGYGSYGGDCKSGGNATQCCTSD
ncbi:MAG TPA: PqqD family peptide modification chaperone [Syntrophorhabdales bacterium]|nr:PqqD family peptide modification chaperone [Syntrophorhabdales bacterium]